MRKILLTMLLAICTLGISAQSASKNEATIVNNIQYKSNKDAYVNERCKLDIILRQEAEGLPCRSLVSWRRTHQWQQAVAFTTDEPRLYHRRRELPLAPNRHHRPMLG